jgi:uncharacterized protein
MAGRKRLFGRKAESGTGKRLFFATDIHGSDRCFRKFLNAGKFYGVDYLILGGDITGKMLVLIEQTSRGWSAQFNDHDYIDITEDERSNLEQLIRDHGQYPIVGTRDELLRLADEATRDAAFKAAIVDGIRRWVEMAEQRLEGTGVRCFVAPGNDDYWEIDEALRGSDVIEFVEGCRVSLDGHEMITTGYSNITPWHSPRELDEAALFDRIDEMYASVDDHRNLIAVIHPPPYNTSLDQAPKIDENFVVQMDGAAPKMAPVGSTAVRRFIEERRPLLGLHGHVHESRAAELVGQTLCLNPGSSYTDGTLMGALVTVGDGRVLAHQFVVG